MGIFIQILNYTSIFITCVYFLKFQLIATMLLHAGVLYGHLMRFWLKHQFLTNNFFSDENTFKTPLRGHRNIGRLGILTPKSMF